MRPFRNYEGFIPRTRFLLALSSDIDNIVPTEWAVYFDLVLLNILPEF
jgi:hypothetical protein